MGLCTSSRSTYLPSHCRDEIDIIGWLLQVMGAQQVSITVCSGQNHHKVINYGW